MSEINYISQHLLAKVKDIYFKLSEKSKNFISKKTDYIFDLLQKNYETKNITFKKYFELKEKVDYTISKSSVIPDKLLDINIDEEIFKKINTKNIIKLNFNGKIIKVTIYNNDKDNDTIFKENINRLLTRMWNLYLLFSEKREEAVALDSSFTFYLYNGPKVANINKSGKNYVKKLSEFNCFNSINGITNPFNIKEVMNPSVTISRYEESIGLLTHEFLHLVYLSNIDNNETDLFESFLFFKDYTESTTPLDINEIFINSFATIIHSYLISKELKMPPLLKDIIRNELIYSFINSIRLSKITNIDLNEIYNMEDIREKSRGDTVVKFGL